VLPPTTGVTCTYTRPGHFTATLVVTDNGGLTSSVCSQGVDVVSNRLPSARMRVTPSRTKEGLPVTFDGCASSDSDGRIVSYAFTFGDGDSTTTMPPTCAASHAYTTAGSYKACLVVTDDLMGHSNPKCQTVTITPNQPPVANFDAKQAATPAFTIAFTDLSKDADGAIAGWAWSFGDSGGSMSQNPTHTYAGKRTFAVCLTVTDNKGAASVPKCKNINVK